MQKRVIFLLIVAFCFALSGCMSLGGTFNKPKQTQFSLDYGEPNECNKIFIGTRENVYLLREHPHAYEIAYFDLLPSFIVDIVLLPVSIPYTGYIYAASQCMHDNL